MLPSTSLNTVLQGRTFLVSDPDAERAALCRKGIVYLGGLVLDSAPDLRADGAPLTLYEIAPYRSCCVFSLATPGVQHLTFDWLCLQITTPKHMSPALSPLYRPLAGPPAVSHEDGGSEGGVPSLATVGIALAGFDNGADYRTAAGWAAREHAHALLMIERMGAIYCGSDKVIMWSATTHLICLHDDADCVRIARPTLQTALRLAKEREDAAVSSDAGSSSTAAPKHLPLETVHIGWLYACVRGWSRVPEEHYRLNEQHLDHPDTLAAQAAAAADREAEAASSTRAAKRRKRRTSQPDPASPLSTAAAGSSSARRASHKNSYKTPTGRPARELAREIVREEAIRELVLSAPAPPPPWLIPASSGGGAGGMAFCKELMPSQISGGCVPRPWLCLRTLTITPRPSQLACEQIFLHLFLWVQELIIASLPQPICIAHTTAILLHDVCAI